MFHNGVRNTVKAIALVILVPTLTGCAFSMASAPSGNRRGDPSALEMGADKGTVYRAIGSPDAAAELANGTSLEIYLIDPNPRSEGGRRAAGVVHLILTIGTFGLWELVGVPYELAVQDRPLTFVLKYDEGGKLVETDKGKEWHPSTLSEVDWEKCQQYASWRAIDVRASNPYVARRGPPDQLFNAIPDAIATSSARAEVYRRTMYECILRIHAEWSR